LSTSSTSWGWLAALPRALRGDVVVHVIDRASDTMQRFAAAPAAKGAGETGGRRVLSATLDERDVTVALSGTCDGDGIAALWDGIVNLAREREQLQRDLEGMYPTSLALLEEASMWGDVLPTLPTGSTEQEVAEIGTRALIVAASAERVLYLRWRPEQDECETLVHMVADGGGARPRSAPPPEPSRFRPGNGLVGQALHGTGAAILARVDELAEVDGPERLANREVIAVPVRYGTEGNTRTLGVLLLIDKIASSYAAGTELSSHETKLAHAVAAMLGSVLGTRRVAELGKELETAREIHRQIQTQDRAAVPGFEIAGCNRACGTVGGDYFDFVSMPDGRTFAALMDVSGHNLASGMLMVSARTSLRVLARRLSCPAEILTELADTMHEDLVRTERFITVAGAALRPQSRQLEVVNAGHLDTLVLRAANGAIEAFASEDVVLGFLPGTRYQARRVDLAPGDLVLLYTDGVVETCDGAEEMFGTERLFEVLRRHRGASAEAVVGAVLDAVDAFRGAASATDDVTLLAIKVGTDGGRER
jgi:hypothetical protein